MARLCCQGSMMSVVIVKSGEFTRDLLGREGNRNLVMWLMPYLQGQRREEREANGKIRGSHRPYVVVHDERIGSGQEFKEGHNNKRNRILKRYPVGGVQTSAITITNLC